MSDTYRKIHKVFDEDAKTSGSSWVKAIASVTIGDDFCRPWRQGAGRIKSADIVVMPATKYKDRYQDTFHPINREARANITSVVLDAYTKYLSQGTHSARAANPKTGEAQDMTQAM